MINQEDGGGERVAATKWKNSGSRASVEHFKGWNCFAPSVFLKPSAGVSIGIKLDTPPPPPIINDRSL